jgi:hypothetical protein
MLSDEDEIENEKNSNQTQCFFTSIKSRFSNLFFHRFHRQPRANMMTLYFYLSLIDFKFIQQLFADSLSKAFD